MTTHDNTITKKHKKIHSLCVYLSALSNCLHDKQAYYNWLI